MSCPSCGARNADRATWCTQCFAALGPPSDDAPLPGPSAAGVAVRKRSGSGPTAASPTSHDVRERDGEVEWRCRGCEGWSPLGAAACGTCGTGRVGFGERPGAPRRVSVGTAVGASLVVPGAGHLLAGAVGSGVARAGLGMMWAAAGIADLRGGSGSTAAVLLAGASILWVASAIDASSLVSGTRGQMLGGRRLAVLVAVVTGGLVVAVTLAALGA